MPVPTAVSRQRAGGETITYLPAVGDTTLSVTTDELWTIEFSRVRPVRGCPSFKGKKSFSGEWWCATTHRHVTFESWVERDFLIDADFDAQVCGIAAQPFRLEYSGAGERRRAHTPDFFLRSVSGEGIVVDVRPDDRIGPDDAIAFDATAQMCDKVGWVYHRVGEQPPVRAANLRWLAGYRHDRAADDDIADALVAAVSGTGGMPIHAAADAVGDRVIVVPTLFHLLWRQRLHSDLSRRPLMLDTVVTAGGAP
ncbi:MULTISPECIES: TnsA-like heteromeric transposase endonuclease subunit [Rhodococcus]|uniref:TnsA-like heteromeric transposase endonuclease subunit n=1 Tax=Rhodococcus TaxID=1827 RepID=UPI0029551A1B|nr:MULTISPECIES: TnsA-like heteromeric transposase endonuclease subunit [Rhodococcus]MDV7246271.1 TnsA-like heteromeric transposase endonuclease subunit [Rhodococcus oxybenzonivorans]MDV7337257.1 TnsA-like heteromeric transposase endonuclease subunit [Rhodococcus oxybenzonivorans]MDV8030755.1 TnsA-like heteromeric transposase endonuclease subunit [Rhodococcus sp. IEGM 27]MDV8030803.1 TnsA-like heteromeric transposase endonuclease subunit [Rhodococcus sp. IEGM 27]